MSLPVYKAQPVAVFPLYPNWDRELTLRVIGSTLINEALDQSEERWQRFPRPLYGLSFETVAVKSEQLGTTRKLFETVEAMPFGVPVWSEEVQLSSDAPSGSLSLNTSSMAGTLFSVFDWVILWQDWQTWEILQCDQAIISGVLALNEATTRDWAAGTKVVPVAFGYVKRPDFSALDAEDAGLTIDFEERFLFGSRQGHRETEIVETTPTVTYGDCNENCTVDFGTTIPGLKRYLVEHSDSRTGPWDHYCEAKRDRTRIVLNNYFGGSKWVRVRFIMLDLSIVDSGVIFRPPAPSVAPPEIVLGSGFTTPLFELPANYMGFAAEDRTRQVLVTADREQIDYNGNAILKIPCGEAFIEVQGKKEILMHDVGDFPSDPTINATTDQVGATVRFTIDGTDPTESTGHTSLYTLPFPSYSFGCVVIARAFKDGCKSPPTYYVIDRNFDFTTRFSTTVNAILSSHSCLLYNWQRDFPDCISQPVLRSCNDEYSTDSPAAIMADYAASLSATGPTGPARDKLVLVDGSSYTITGATSDPGGCGHGVTWSEGQINMVVSMQAIRDIVWGSEGVLGATLATFPNSITCAYVEEYTDNVTPSPPSHSIFQPGYKDRLQHDFFGPDRADHMTADLGAAKAFLATQAETIGALIGFTDAFYIYKILMICTLAPTRAEDLWNSDDVL